MTVFGRQRYQTFSWAPGQSTLGPRFRLAWKIAKDVYAYPGPCLNPRCENMLE